MVYINTDNYMTLELKSVLVDKQRQEVLGNGNINNNIMAQAQMAKRGLLNVMVCFCIT